MRQSYPSSLIVFFVWDNLFGRFTLDVYSSVNHMSELQRGYYIFTKFMSDLSSSLIMDTLGKRNDFFGQKLKRLASSKKCEANNSS